jgi:hypothetical protein
MDGRWRGFRDARSGAHSPQGAGREQNCHEFGGEDEHQASLLGIEGAVPAGAAWRPCEPASAGRRFRVTSSA